MRDDEQREHGFLGIDSLYLVVEYPHVDVFERWSEEVNLSDLRLIDGVVCDDFVLRRGGLGYKLSVWDGDARLFMTDRVDDRESETGVEGMGLMLQLGPKWLRLFGEAFAPNTLRRNVLSQLELFGVEDPGGYPIRLNRMDIALDVVGMSIAEFDTGEWMEGWVGYARPRHFYMSGETGRLEGLAVGSSRGAVRFKAYDKLAEAMKRGTTAFWRSVWGAEEDDLRPVTRFEWTVRCYEAGFTGMRYLADLTFEGFCDVLNYASLRWGRLCVPAEDSRTYWKLALLWGLLREYMDDWMAGGWQRMAKREYVLDVSISPAYLKALAGWLSGFEARIGLATRSEQPASMARALSYLHEAGYTMEDIAARAREKWAVYSRLMPPRGL